MLDESERMAVERKERRAWVCIAGIMSTSADVSVTNFGSWDLWFALMGTSSLVRISDCCWGQSVPSRTIWDAQGMILMSGFCI